MRERRYFVVETDHPNYIELLKKVGWGDGTDLSGNHLRACEIAPEIYRASGGLLEKVTETMAKTGAPPHA